VGTVSTKHVVLGLLIERRGYGYELQQRLRTRFAFLSPSENAVYPILDKLERDGLIVVDERKPARTRRGHEIVIYAATPDGEDEFVRWLGEPCDIGQAREEIYVKLVLSNPIHWPRVIAMAEGLEKACLTAVRELQRNGQPTLEQLMDDDPPDSLVVAVLVDDAELLRLRALLHWLQRVKVYGEKRLERQAEGGG